MRMSAGIAVLFLLTAMSSAAEPDYLPADALHAAGLTKFWQVPLPLERDQRLQHVYLVDDALYLGTNDGYVFALHAHTGVLRWLQPVTRSGYALRRPCHVGDRVVFVTPADLQIYDRLTGDPLTRHDLRFSAGSAVVTDGKQLFIGGMDRRLYALDAATQFVEWKVLTNAAILSTPVVHNDLIYFASDAGTVYASTPNLSRRLRWQFQAFERVTADLLVRDEGVYVASRDQSLYLLDLGFGQVRWRARFAGPLYEPPVVLAGVAYQHVPAEGLAAVDAAIVGAPEERIRWRLPLGRVALAGHAGAVYVLTTAANLLAVDAKSGDAQTVIPAPGFTLGVPAQETAAVYLAAPDGRVFCARVRGATPPTAQDVLSAVRPAGTTPVAVGPAPTTRPAVQADDPLSTKRRGPPVGGRSEVSRTYQPKAGEEQE